MEPTNENEQAVQEDARRPYADGESSPADASTPDDEVFTATPEQVEQNSQGDSVSAPSTDYVQGDPSQEESYPTPEPTPDAAPVSEPVHDPNADVPAQVDPEDPPQSVPAEQTDQAGEGVSAPESPTNS